jgi:polyisoprenoid-binding protein YceI
MRFMAGWILLLAGCGENAAEPTARAGASPRGDRFTIDASAGGRFTAKVGAGGALSAFGHEHTMALRAFSGEARLGSAGPEGGTLRLSVVADSVAEIGEKFSEDERKKINQDVHAKVLEAPKYPRIDFQGTAVSATSLGENRYQVRIDGQLTLHGVTKPLTIPAEVTVRGDTLTARGEFTLKHSDYGLERLSAVGGLVKASDPIAFSFDLVGRAR